MTLGSNDSTGLADERFVAPSGAGPATVRIDPTLPAYVVPISVDTPRDAKAFEARGGVDFLLVDNQSTAVESFSRYRRCLIRFLNEAGIAEFSQQQMRFDPQFQTLTWHRFGIHRAGVFRDQLDLRRIHTAREELGLEERMYDQLVTQVPIAFDLRVGDVLEYACSINGSHPCFHPNLGTTQYLQWGVPVKRLFIRHTHPEAANLAWQRIRTDADVQATTSSGVTALTVTLDNIPASDAEPYRPAWYATAPYLQFSDYPSWNAVAQQISALFAQPVSNLTDLQEFVRSITRRVIGKEKVAEELLNFVQREIRYLHVGGGVFGVTPHDPGKIFAQRYGDCKDKSLLLTTLLELAGIPALPVLVSTTEAIDLPNLLPSPNVFDHAIVCINLDDTYIWVDPTMTNQSGPIKERFLPNFRWALPVHLDTQALVAIPFEPKPELFHIRELIECGLPGDTASLTIVTTAEGYEADQLRNMCQREGKHDVARRYLEFNQRRMKQAHQTHPLDVTDQPAHNRMILTESYELPDFPPVDGSWTRRIWLMATEISRYLPLDDFTNRRSPIGLFFPGNYIHEYEVSAERLDLPLLAADCTIDNPFFTFKRTCTQKTSPSPLSTVRFELTIKSDHVPADQAAVLNEELRKLHQSSGVELAFWKSRSFNAVFNERSMIGLMLGPLLLAVVLKILFTLFW